MDDLWQTPRTGNDSVTFYWYGAGQPRLVADFTGWQEGESFEMTERELNVWAYTAALPRDAYIEYCFLLDGERVLDPRNPRIVSNGMGGSNNYFYMPAGGPTELAQRDLAVPQGRLTGHQLKGDCLVIGGDRLVTLYQPPGDEPAPLLVVLDGQDYLSRANLPVMVDNLIAQRRIRPLALAMVQNGGAQGRFIEYACSDSTLVFLLQRVLPLAQTELRLLDPAGTPGAYGVLGASMGGLFALYAALRRPEIFGHVLSQSGAFAMWNHDAVVFDLLRDGKTRPLDIWLDVGKYELFLDANRRMRQLMVEKRYPVAYREYNAGHNYSAWRDDLWRGLVAQFGA